MSDQEQGALADWLVAWDDGICDRLTCCTLCGRRPVVRWGLCGSATGPTLGYVLCRGHDTVAGVRHVEQLFGRRYGAGARG